MPSLTNLQLQEIRRFPQHTQKYISIAPRNIVFQAQVTNPVVFDNDTGCYYGIRYTAPIGDPNDVEEGMLVYVGTAYGKDDIGRAYVRKPIDITNAIIPIHEVPYGDLPFTQTSYITIYDAYEPHTKLIRLVGVKTGGSQFVNDFVEYHNYDEEYTDQNTNIVPIVNIFSQTVGSFPIFPRLAAFVDPNQNYRTLTLQANVINLGSSNTITYQWKIKDCTLVAGSLTSASITIRVPIGFRYVSLTVSNGVRSTTRRIPLWTHGRTSYLPIGESATGFNITSDTTDDGREMTIDFFGTTISDSLLPIGALVCYWEEPDNITIPFYRYQFHGWVYETSTEKPITGKVTVKVGGIASWMKKLVSFGTQINAVPNPRKWFEMPTITLDRFVHYLLREYSNVLTLSNFYISGSSRTAKVETSQRASLWEACVNVCKAYEMRNFLADSNNSLWIREHWSYMPDGSFNLPNQRNATVTMTIVADDLDGEDPLVINEQIYKPIGRSDGTGDIWPLTAKEPIVVASRAPSKSSGQGSGSDDLPFQRLLGTTESEAQFYLNWLVGQHYALKNSRLQEVDITFVGSHYDVFEPAWGEAVILDYNTFDLDIIDNQSIFAIFRVVKVTIDHPSDRGTRRKTIKLTLEEITLGIPGVTIPIPKGQWVDNPMWDFQWRVSPALPRPNFDRRTPAGHPPIEKWEDIAVSYALVLDRTSLGRVARTFNFHQTYPLWEPMMQTLWNPNGVVWYSFDAKLVGEALLVRMIGLTNAQVYIARCNNALAEEYYWEIEAQFNHNTPTFDGMAIIRTCPDTELWVAVWVGTDGTRCVKSTGNNTWSSIQIVGNLITGTSTELKEVGLDIQNGRAVTTGKDTLGNWRIFYSDGMSSTWTLSNISPQAPKPYNTIKWSKENGVYISNYIGQPVISTITVNDLVPNRTHQYEEFGRISEHPFNYGFRGQNAIADLENSSLVDTLLFDLSKTPKITSFKTDIFRNVAKFASTTAFSIPPFPTNVQNTTTWSVEIELEIHTTEARHFWRWRENISAYIYWQNISPPKQTDIFIWSQQPSFGTPPPTALEYPFNKPYQLIYLRWRRRFLDRPAPFYDSSMQDRLNLLPEITLFGLISNSSHEYKYLRHAVNGAFYYRDESVKLTNPDTTYYNLYLQDLGGFLPYTANGIGVDKRNVFEYYSANGNRLGDYQYEHRISLGQDVAIPLVDPTYTNYIRGIIYYDPLLVSYGQDIIQMRWRNGMFEDKRGDWFEKFGQVPNIGDMVMIL